MGSPRLDVTCRPARPEDTPFVLELTRTIWEGNDYVPEVWDEWLADPQGRLLVAEYQGKVLGLSKLSQLTTQDWWMQGLRVHPEFEGQGIASQLTEATVQSWLEMGAGAVRLGTASFRLAVQHLCERLGFEKVSERAPFYAASLVENQSASLFEPVGPDEITQALDFARKSPSQALTADLIDLGWHYAQPREQFLAAAVERKQAWWWRGRQALVTARIDEDDELGIAPSIELVACPLETIDQILLDYRILAGEIGYTQAAWMAPLRASLLPLLEQSGYKRVWENSLYIYAKVHPESRSSSGEIKL